MSILSYIGGLGNQALNAVGLPGVAGSNPMQNNTVYNPGNGGGTVGGVPVDAAGQYYGAPNGGSYTPAPSGGGGGGGDTYSAPVRVDPYAAWGGATNYNNLISGFNTQKDTVRGSALDSASNWGLGYGASIRDLVSSLANSQRGIDKAGVQNELARKSGTQGVQSMVGRGLKQAGTMLAQKNASNSSASEAVSRAYGDLGRQQLSKVGGQYAAGLADIQDKQNELVEQQGLGVNKLQIGKEQFINSTVADAQNKLAALDAQIAGANLPNRIAIEQEKNNIRAEALARLQSYDAELSSGVSRIKPTSIDERRTAALQQMNQGVAPETAFDYTTETPAQFQNTGPFSSGLPLFTMPRGSRRE